MDKTLVELLHTPYAEEVVARTTGYPMYGKKERGFYINEGYSIVELNEGTATTLDMPHFMNLGITPSFVAHYHPDNKFLPSLKDIKNQLLLSLMTRKKGLLPHFGILAVDNNKGSGNSHNVSHYPEMFCYNLHPSVEMLANYDIKTLYPNELKEKLRIYSCMFELFSFAEQSGEIIFYDPKTHSYPFLEIVTSAYDQIMELSRFYSSQWELMSFGDINKELEKSGYMEIYGLISYERLCI